jgi:hypothetical protein
LVCAAGFRNPGFASFSDEKVFSHFSWLRLLRLTPKIGTLHLYSLSTLRRSQLFEYLCCLAAYRTCTKLPGSASDGAFEALTSPALLPLLGPLNAPGHASNAFRRDAARSFGLHATPAPFFTLSGRGCSRLPCYGDPRPLAVPPPPSPRFFNGLHRCCLRQVRVTPAALTIATSSPADVSTRPFLPAGHRAILWSVRNPSDIR